MGLVTDSYNSKLVVGNQFKTQLVKMIDHHVRQRQILQFRIFAVVAHAENAGRFGCPDAVGAVFDDDAILFWCHRQTRGMFKNGRVRF